MWNLKFTVKNKDSIYTVLSAKYAIKDFMYPRAHYEEDNFIMIEGSHTIEGEEAEVKKFMKALKSHKKTKHALIHGSHILTLIQEEETFYKHLFAPNLFHLTPVLIENGYEEWNIASWNRERLEDLLKEIKLWKNEFEELTVKKIVELDPQGIYFPQLIPKLARRQRELFLFALDNGYYKHPRKITLQGLAKQKKLAISTVQEHLRKAESKLMPFFSSQIEK